MSDWAFIEHVTDYMVRPRMGDSKAPTLWPSEASAIITNEWGEEEVVGKCRRATFFRYLLDSYKYSDEWAFYKPLVDSIKGEVLAPDRYMLWIWRAGELYEEFCVGLARESGVFIADQVPVYVQEFNLSGKIDLVVIDPETGKLHKTEIKSVYGHNADFVLGKAASRKKGELGTPKDSNLMQIALYQWRPTTPNPDAFGDGRLVYGARDTGRYAEYSVEVREKDGLTKIFYTGIAPNKTKEIESPITITSILEQYRFVDSSLKSGVVPERDYDIQYSDEKIQLLYERGQLGKADTERTEKRLAQIAEGKTRLNKQLEKGDWQCRFCSFANICYNKEGEPREL